MPSPRHRPTDPPAVNRRVASLRGLALTGLTLVSAPAGAGLFCVGDAGELSAALFDAAFNGEDDEIRIRSGTYIAPASGGFLYSPPQGGDDSVTDVAVSGGWSGSSCTRKSLAAHATRLQGGGARVLRLTAHGGATFSVSNLTIAGGIVSPGQGALDLRSTSSSAPVVIVERVRFVDNQGFAALHVESDRMIRLIGTIFASNELSVAGGGSAVIRRTGTNGNALYVINNTVTANSADGAGWFTGLRLENWGADETVVVNNVFWGNEGGDVLLFGPIAPFSHNDFGVVDGTWTGTGNLQVEPLFLDPAAEDYRLHPDSPLVDAGIGAGIDYPPDRDLLGLSRPVNAYDLGAYEHHPTLFADGFESGDTSAWSQSSP